MVDYRQELEIFLMLKIFRLKKLSRQNFAVHNLALITPSQPVLVG